MSHQYLLLPHYSLGSSFLEAVCPNIWSIIKPMPLQSTKEPNAKVVGAPHALCMHCVQIRPFWNLEPEVNAG